MSELLGIDGVVEFNALPENLENIVLNRVGKPLFSDKVAKKFADNKKADNTYTIEPDDIDLIKNVKALINLIRSI